MQSKKYVSGVLTGIIAILLAGCGSSSSSTTTGTGSTGPLTGIKKRVLVSNVTPAGGDVMIVDAQKNIFAVKTIAATQPSKMVTAKGQTVILNSGTPQVTVFANSTEVVTGSVTMQGQPFDVAISPDGSTGYAAIKNVGVVEVVNTTGATLGATMTVPSVARLVEGTNGHKMLAFADNPQGLASPNTNAFFVIDTGTNTVAAVTMPAGSQPFTAVFDPTDATDTTAFILNCGAECGGTAAASVVKVNFGGSTPTFTAVTGPANAFTASAIAGATVGTLSGSKLFVAGTLPNPPGGACPSNLPNCGTVQVIDTGTLTAGAPIPITDGVHLVMAITSNNRLYVGAAGCTVGPVSAQNTLRGCLSIFDTGSGSSSTNPAVPSESSLRQNFDVTGLQPISGENTIYVVQGGQLDIFDITTGLPSTSITQLDVVGKALDALQIDP
jgi:hypothetical protein